MILGIILLTSVVIAYPSAAGNCGQSNPCPSGYCCSKWGFCGTTTEYCDPAQGCQSQFGHCGNIGNVSTSSYPLPSTCTSQSLYATPTPSNVNLGSAAVPSGLFFAPYVDITTGFSIKKNSNAVNSKYYTLAFIVADVQGNPSWGGSTPLSQNLYADEVSNIRSNGGDVIISFGGAAGSELAISPLNNNPETLAFKYQQVIDKYQLKKIDFDIESAAASDKATIDIRNKAIAKLQKMNPGLYVSYTLAALPTGLTEDGLYILKNAKDNKVHIDIVNVMAMDFGPSLAPEGKSKMLEYVIKCAQSTQSQLQATGLTGTKLGITPMIGQNDQLGEVFQLQDAQNLVKFAKSNAFVGMISMWSLNRDNGNNSESLAASSKISQSPFAFAKIFSAVQ